MRGGRMCNHGTAGPKSKFIFYELYEWSFRGTYGYFDWKQILLNTLEKLSILLVDFRNFSSKTHHFHKNILCKKSVRATETTLLQFIKKNKFDFGPILFHSYTFDQRAWGSRLINILKFMHVFLFFYSLLRHCTKVGNTKFSMKTINYSWKKILKDG